MATSDRSNENSNPLYRHVQQGINTIRECLANSTTEVKNGIFEQMKGKGIAPGIASIMIRDMEEQQKAISDEADEESELLAERVGADLDIYLSTLIAYACEADPLVRRSGITESFESAVKRINAVSMKHLTTAIDLIEKDGASQHPEEGKALAYLKKWAAERERDQFGFYADSKIFIKAIEKMECPSDDVAVWDDRLATLSYTITYAVARSITYNALCLSARAYAAVDMHKDAMDCLTSLTEVYNQKQDELLLRESIVDGEDDQQGGIMEAS